MGTSTTAALRGACTDLQRLVRSVRKTFFYGLQLEVGERRNLMRFSKDGHI